MRNASVPGLVPSVLVPGLILLFPATVWPAVIVYHLFCIAVPLLTRTPLKSLGITGGFSWRWILLAASFSISVIGAGLLLAQFVLRADGPALGYLRELAPQNLPELTDPWTLFAVYSLCLNPLAEEVFWRGYMVDRAGITTSVILFAVMHGMALCVLGHWTGVLLVLPVFLIGLLWGWARKKSGSLWPCVITHAAVDAAILICLSVARHQWGTP